MATAPLTYPQKGTVRVVFYPFKSQGRTIYATFDPNVLRDVISGSTTKDIGLPAGSFQLNLVPRQEYLTVLNPGDWLHIYLNDGIRNPKEPYMKGSIDRIALTRNTDNRGAVSERITITGRDYGKVLTNTQMTYDPTMSNEEYILGIVRFSGFFLNTRAAGKLPIRPVDQVIKVVLDGIYANRNQMIPPSGAGPIDDLDYSTHVQNSDTDTDEAGNPVPAGIPTNWTLPNIAGNLWGALEANAHSLLNELFVDTVRGDPALYLREHPYSHKDFTKLPGVPIDATEVQTEDIGKSEADHRNWWRVFAEGDDALGLAEGAGWCNPQAMQQHGVTRCEERTSHYGELNKILNVTTVDGKTRVSGLLHDWAGKLATWHYADERLLAGTMTTRLRADARIGKRLDYTNERTGDYISFYIQGVTQNFQYPSSCSTTFSLVRGVRRNTKGGVLKFDHLKTLSDLGNVIVPIRDFRILQASKYGMQTQQIRDANSGPLT